MAQAPLVQPAAPSEVARVEATPFDARSRARREAPVPAGRAKVSAERVPVGAPPSENAPGAPAAAVAAFADEEGSRSAGPASLPALPAPDTLREETELVDAALYAVRLGEQERARALLEEHARRFPNGALARERLRALERLSAPAATRQEAPR